MDPNSANQRWSFWQYRIYPDRTKRPEFPTIKENCARFARTVFGQASEMRVVVATDQHARLYVEVSVRTEGHPVHEAPYVTYMHEQWDRFLRNGFGPTCEIQSHAHLEAGSRQDGTPADQLIILPTLRVEEGRSHE
jgi:hypothetical protein